MKYSLENDQNAGDVSPLIKRANNADLVGDTVKMKKSSTADTRSAETKVDIHTLTESTMSHIQDVRNVMQTYAVELTDRAAKHDWTKVRFMDEFHKQFAHAQETGDWPSGKEWWYDKYHLVERHHLKDRVPEDVDLFDVLEMIADCCAAGMARSGEYRDDDPDNIKDILYKAYKNTVKKTLTRIEVYDPDKGE